MGHSRLNIVVAGVGEMGEFAASTFASRGHNVLVIDTSEERLLEVSSRLDVKTFFGHASSTETLKNVNAGKADLFVALTGNDLVNLVSATKARQMGAKRVAAVIDSVEHFDTWEGIYHHWLGVDLVLNTRFLVANELNKLIRTRGAVAVQDFAENKVEMVQFRVSTETPYVERPLSQINLPWECLIVAIRRGRSLIIPRGDDEIYIGDEVLLIGRTDQMLEIAEAFGRKDGRRGKIIVLGGGTVGFVLTKALSRFMGDITLIERDRGRCEFLAKELPSVSVLEGDGTSASLLLEEGIEQCDVFAAVSGEDERNIIAARLAKELGAGRCIALVSRPYFVDVCRHLGLEVVPGPAQIVIRELLRCLTPSGILGTTPVMGGEAEFIEAVVSQGAPICGRALRDAGFPRGSVVCATIKEGRTIIPKGNTILEAGSQVVVFALSSVRREVERLLTG